MIAPATPSAAIGSAGAPSLDPMCGLYAEISALGQLQVQSGEHSIEADHEQLDHDLADERAALAREEANEASCGRGFFGSVCKLLGDVAGDALHLRVARAFSDVGKDLADAWNSPKFWTDLEAGLKVVDSSGDTDYALEAALFVAHVRVTNFSAAVIEARADFTVAKGGAAGMGRSDASALDELRASSQLESGALAALADAIRANDQTPQVVVSNIRG